MYWITYSRPGRGIADEIKGDPRSAIERYRGLAEDSNVLYLNMRQIKVVREINDSELEAMIGTDFDS